MLWVVRGTYGQTGEDVSVVVEADTRAEAEYMAERRGIPVVVVAPATAEDLNTARQEKRLFNCEAKTHYTCFGRPVGAIQLAGLMLTGIITMLAILQRTHVLWN